MYNKKVDKSLVILFIFSVSMIFLSLFFLEPSIKGDSVTYVDTMNFLKTGQTTDDFIPNRIITTFAGMQIIIFLGGILGSENIVWLVMNSIFYLISVIVFYKLCLLIFKEEKVALLCSLFVAGNYAMISFGIHYLMDMGGWMFYLISLFFVFRYSDFRNRNDLLLASISVGVGGLFKEYALLGVIPIATILIYENKQSLSNIFKKSLVPVLLTTIPISVVYIYVYLRFKYTYADWFADSYKYEYSANIFLRILEYIKSFGSLYNILTILVIMGFGVIWKDRLDLDKRKAVFVLGAILSFMPVFLWGGITQRILFITVPALVIISGFAFKRFYKYHYIFYLAFVVYTTANIFMDKYLLPVINLPF